MPTRNVDLTDDLDRFVEAGVASGRFGNASEVVGEALYPLEQREREDHAKLEWLRNAVNEGFDAIDRGEYVTLNSEQEVDNFIDKLREEVSAELAAKRNSA